MRARLNDLKRQQASEVAVLAPLALLALCCGICLLPWASSISYPPSEWIATDYLWAVVRRDRGAFDRLAAQAPESCRPNLEAAYAEEVALFGGAEVRDLTTVVEANTGSDEELQLAVLSFAFRGPGDTNWRAGELGVVTDHDVLGLRYMCSVSHAAATSPPAP